MDYDQMYRNQLAGLFGNQALGGQTSSFGFLGQSFNPLDEMLKQSSIRNDSYFERCGKSFKQFRENIQDVNEIACEVM